MRLITLAIVAAFAAGACGRFQKEAPGVSVDVVGTPGQVQGIMADQNATHVQTLGIATGTPTATATEAQQMTSGGYGYGSPYGAIGVYGYNGAGATLVPPSYYMSGASTTSIPPLPEGGQGGPPERPTTVGRAGVGALSSTIQPIIVLVPGNAGDAARVGNLMNATGYLIELDDKVIKEQKYQRQVMLHWTCVLQFGHGKQCPVPRVPVEPQTE